MKRACIGKPPTAYLAPSCCWVRTPSPVPALCPPAAVPSLSPGRRRVLPLLPPAVHDQINLLLIPAIGFLTIAGLLGHIDPAVTTWAFLAYVGLDSVWLVLQASGRARAPWAGAGCSGSQLLG